MFGKCGRKAAADGRGAGSMEFLQISGRIHLACIQFSSDRRRMHYYLKLAERSKADSFNGSQTLYYSNK